MGLSGEGTLTAALRELLLRAGNKPSKISALYDQLRSVEKFQRVTKTHIKDKIIRPMVLRGEVIRAPMDEVDSKGRVRRVYAMRLKVNGTMRRRTAGLGITLPDASESIEGAARASTPAAVELQ